MWTIKQVDDLLEQLRVANAHLAGIQEELAKIAAAQSKQPPSSKRGGK
jgi:hypothetical protein